MLQHITELFNQYGYIVLYIALTLELIAFPTPGETLMTYCGFLVYQQHLNWGVSILTASAGCITGITISYFIGRVLGRSFFDKYGVYIHMGPDKLAKASKWFEKYGNGLLVLAYYIPGIRHITGYFSGVTRILYKRFAFNAYLGAIVWTSTFISLGKVLGSNWEYYHASIKKYLIITSISLGILLLCIYLYKKYKQRIFEFTIALLERSFVLYHSFGRIKLIMIGLAGIFIVLSVFAAGLIQDYMANEFTEFDTVLSFLVDTIFTGDWYRVMTFFGFLASFPVLAAIASVSVIWIVIKGKKRAMEIRFLLITLFGGVFVNLMLRYIFHRIGPRGISLTDSLRYTFPSEFSFMAIAAYGFLAYMILRHASKRRYGTITIILSVVVCMLTGFSSIYFHLLYPSDIVAGYAFGGVWLCLNIILMEIFKVIPNIRIESLKDQDGL